MFKSQYTEGMPLKDIRTFILFIKKETDMTTKRLIKQHSILFLLFFLLILPLSPLTALGQEEPGARLDSPEFAHQHIDTLHLVAGMLQDLAAKPLPENLTADEKKEAMRYTRWLTDSSIKLNDLALRWQDILSSVVMIKNPDLSQKRIEDVNKAYKWRYAALRNKLLDELRQYGQIPQSMKGNYDSAQSSINKLR
jgi:hypothetical protein